VRPPIVASTTANTWAAADPCHADRQRPRAVGTDPCFTKRQLRETFGWGDFAIRRHLARLVELEWVQVSRGPGSQLVDDGTNLSRIPDLARPSER
jgi:hypothetical protein